MHHRYLSLLSFVLVIGMLFTGCSRRVNPLTETQALIEPWDFDHPDVVVYRDMLSSAIHRHSFPFKLSEIASGVDETSTEFFFDMTYDDIIDDQVMTVSVNAYDGVVQKGFEITFYDCEDYAISEAILCSICAVAPDMDIEEVVAYYDLLLSGYSGNGRSQAISINDYHLHVLNSGWGPFLRVISDEMIYAGEHAKQYEETKFVELYNEANIGMKVRLTGEVVEILDNDYDEYFVLEVLVNNEIIGIYCKEDVFGGCFSCFDDYTFYGQLARSRDEYGVCLKLDYFDK